MSSHCFGLPCRKILSELVSNTQSSVFFCFFLFKKKLVPTKVALCIVFMKKSSFFSFEQNPYKAAMEVRYT